jgi:hypothetical protein
MVTVSPPPTLVLYQRKKRREIGQGGAGAVGEGETVQEGAVTGPPVPTGKHDVAQICRNGHVINATARGRPQFNSKFCKTCGAGTITICKNKKCRLPIQGAYWTEGYGSQTIGLTTKGPAPAFCSHCGKPYPWTQARRKAALRLATEADALSRSDRELLKRSLDDILTDTPKTSVAATHIKRLLAKARDETLATAFKEIILPVVTKAAKELIWGTVPGV